MLGESIQLKNIVIQIKIKPSGYCNSYCNSLQFGSVSDKIMQMEVRSFLTPRILTITTSFLRRKHVLNISMAVCDSKTTAGFCERGRT